MKKAVLITLIVMVTAAIGLVLYMQLSKTTPAYAGSDKVVVQENDMLEISSKYYIDIAQAEIDVALADVADGVEGALTAYDAILAKGKPVFHPTFSINITDFGKDFVRVSGEATDVPMDGQKQLGFFCDNLMMNVYTDGQSRILSMNTYAPTELEKVRYVPPVVADDGMTAQAICDITTAYDFNLAFLDGATKTTVTFEWKYDVKNSAPLNLSGITEQELVADVVFTVNNGVVSAQFA